MKFDRKCLWIDGTGALCCPRCKRLDFMRLIGTRAFDNAVHLSFKCTSCQSQANLIIRQDSGIPFYDGHTSDGYVYVEWEANTVPKHLQYPDWVLGLFNDR